MRIRELSHRTGVSAKTIRYYEEIGLLPPPLRAENNYRQYGEQDVERLHLVTGARRLDLSLEEIGELLALRERREPPCRVLLERLEHKADEIAGRIRALQEMESELRALHTVGLTFPTDDVDGKDCVCHLVSGNEQTFTAQKLLIATGRQPNTEDVGLEEAGVKIDEHGFVKVNDELQTHAPNIWAAGDVIGNHLGNQFATPVGAHDGVIAAKNALADVHLKVEHRVIPRAIFTDPQVAVVGQTDKEAVGAGIRCWCGTIPLELVPRAGATHQTVGLAKMVINRDTQEVVGVSLVMPNAGEVIHEAAMAMRFHARLEDFIDMVHVYPTMAEALKIAAISYFKDPSKLSCCAE